MFRTYVLVVCVFPTIAFCDESPNVLPDNWHGHWKGKLVIAVDNGKETTVPMELVVAPNGKGLRLANHLWRRRQETGAGVRAVAEGKERPVHDR